MKKVKNYIEPDLAKKKIARYRYWSLKDENGITICSSDENPDGKDFGEWLDKIIGDNVDAEVQVKYGSNEQSSRNNPPFFIKINEEIEWVDPEEPEQETVNINGVAHPVDKKGNVNINFPETKVEQAQPYDTFKTEMEIQLSGLRKEYQLKEEKWQLDLHNKLCEQNIKFKEMMLSDRESRIKDKELALQQLEQVLEGKQKDIQENLKGYLKEVPGVLGGLVRDYLKNRGKEGLAGTEKETEEKPKPKRNPAKFSIEQEETTEEMQEEVDAEIARYEQEEPENEPEQSEAPEQEEKTEETNDNNEPKKEEDEKL